MRRIPLKTVDITLPGSDAPQKFRYSDAIVGIINSAGIERGVPLAEISKSLRIIEPLSAAVQRGDDQITLEDADWEHLHKMVQGFAGWRIVHRAVVDFVADISGAEKVIPEGGPTLPSKPEASRRGRH